MDYEKTEGGILVPSSNILTAGKYHGQIIRDGKVIDEFEDANLVVNEGLNSLLNVYMNAATQITAWYIGVFEGNYTPVATVTAATITSADAATRKASRNSSSAERLSRLRDLPNMVARASMAESASRLAPLA